MALILNLPEGPDTPHLRPRITVVGVGGAGGNAINNMIESNLAGVDFVVANTDAQALALSRTSRRIQLGSEVTQGLGAGAQPEIGRLSAEEAAEAIAAELQGSHMVFITAGMGGGTGTGAAPVVAKIARELGILTVGVVTKPFQFEGAFRMRIGETGIDELAQEVDTLIIIPNQNLFHIANERTTFADAFRLADDVLYSGVRSITDLMINPGLINLDFADVRRVMQNMGRAMMGTGEAEGERRALDAAELAIANPLLEDTSMRGAQGVLINIMGGPDLTLYEADEAANRIREEVEGDALIIVGSTLDETLAGRIRVSVVAAGINAGTNHLCQSTTGGPQAIPAGPAPQQTAGMPPAYAQPYPQTAGADPRAQVPPGMMVAPAPAPVQRPGQFAAQHPQAAPAHTPAPAPVAAQVPPAQIVSEPQSREVIRMLEDLVLETNARRDPAPRGDVRPESFGGQANAPARPSGQAPFIPQPAVETPVSREAYMTDQPPTAPMTSPEPGPMVPGGMSAADGAPAGFPPPLPGVAPAARPLTAPPRPRQSAPQRQDAPESFLKKLTRLGRGSPAKSQEPRAKVVSSSSGSAAHAIDPAVDTEEKSDIPAFLRRQAN